ncbi:hypothetical protein ZIOFF_070510 [Zingiber officinale]|uniref:Uncharacterized protein n=1 Tax=Zingiber officinale TaxID=94328 RepID=A0A8J5CU35_ZINOF|nr:hypothetical protein ZIOFF_070510 [Zingiber officinale]
MEALSAFKIHYLDKKEVTLRTDCQAIIKFFNKSVSNKPSRVRWIAFTDYITGTEINIEFEHVEGTNNQLADALSRIVHHVTSKVTLPECQLQLLKQDILVKVASAAIEGLSRIKRARLEELSEKGFYGKLENLRTTKLEYLDLEVKEPLQGISNNISVIYDRLQLHSKVSIAEYKSIIELLNQIQDEIIRISKEQEKIQKGILFLQKEILILQPVTKEDLKKLTSEISELKKVVQEIKRQVS